MSTCIYELMLALVINRDININNVIYVSVINNDQVARKYMYDERKRREQDVSRIIVCFSVKNLLKWI